MGKVAGIGIASPGPLNIRTGVINFAALLGWHNVPLRDRISRELGVPVWLENDANAAGLGECHYGAGRNVSNMVYVTISTGIGSGIIVNRHIYHGRHDSAGEFGHICIEPEGRSCSCGRRGCLQAYASGAFLAGIARERLAALGKPSLILDLVGGVPERIDALILEKAARQGDPTAIAIWNEMGVRLGHGFSILVQLFDPELIVIGGGLSKAWSLFSDSALKTIRQHTYQILADDLKIVPAELGDEAGLYGAMAVALEQSAPAASDGV
jgi:glucokinase